MRQFLKSLGFNIKPDFDDLMGMMKAAQQVRMKNDKTVTDKLTRSTALALINFQSPDIQRSFAHSETT